MDPIMEEVFAIIVARGEVTHETLAAYLRALDDPDGLTTYQSTIAPAINAVEDAIKEWEGQL